MEELIAVILAAGEGTRMKSSLPKVLHRLCGKPMLWHVLESAKAVTDRQVVITGYGSEQVREYFGEDLFYLEQQERLGTGHALQQSLPCLPEAGLALVLCGDTPLLEKEVLQELISLHRQSGAAATVLTSPMKDPSGYGRIVRDENGDLLKIVEELHLTPEERLLGEINTGTYCFNIRALKKFLPLLPKNEEKGEYYLTDLVHMLVEAGLGVRAQLVEDARLALGINDRLQLSQAAALMREKINERLMLEGVTIIDPASTYIDAGVEVGTDTIIYPQTVLEGKTKVGKNCRLGPGAHLIDTRMGDDVLCRHSLVLESVIENGVNIGPYAHIRPGCKIGSSVKIGDFVEIKNSSIERGSKVPHLSYIGDAEIGSGVNMGAGSIVVNYDGRRKHKTIIEEGAFIGCNSNLVAPLSIGKESFIAAGSTVTRDVPPGSLMISRPGQEIKKGLGKRFLQKKKE
jgi:bifunctional UDP-N-acetylglucosamine pyrophosphorylase/glucosamine-1-phosphate N-acetyltransferase